MDPITDTPRPNPVAGIGALFGGSPVIPVLTLDDPQVAVDLARALVAGGLAAVEVTLRTAKALDCIRAIARDVPDALVGAGTSAYAGRTALLPGVGSNRTQPTSWKNSSGHAWAW